MICLGTDLRRTIGLAVRRAAHIGFIAATRNVGRAETVYHNLNCYVEFVAQHLPITLEAKERS